jgi:CheY-like chemotaxis protein/MinD-like ATPase involved in chromosome partitioning or flagellar assembly
MGDKILIVDDDLESLKLIGLMLRRRGFEVISASAGRQALEHTRGERPDLVILDIMMPDMDGYEVCQRLRSDPETSDVPVIMFTAKTLVGDKVAGFHAGADDYLTKPIHPSELVTRVESLLERAQQNRAQAASSQRGRIIGVMGAKGGVGATTVAVNLALVGLESMRGGQGKEDRTGVSLVDLHEGLSTVALQLGQSPGAGWTNLLDRPAEALDKTTVTGQTVVHSSGLRYLSASIQPVDRQPVLPREHVHAVIDRLADDHSAVVVDLGSQLNRATRDAIANCDLLLLVIEPERICFAMAQELLDRLKALDAERPPIRAVLVERATTAFQYSRDEVKQLLGQEPVAVLNPAPEVMREAADKGRPAVLLYPESKVAGQFRALARELRF